MRQLLVVLSASLALLTSALAARAAEIVDATYVTAALKRGAIVWDLRSAEDYDKGHIPGAVNIGNGLKALRNPNTEDYLDTVQAEKLMNAAGIDLAKEVITYTRMGDPMAYWGLRQSSISAARTARSSKVAWMNGRQAGKRFPRSQPSSRRPSGNTRSIHPCKLG